MLEAVRVATLDWYLAQMGQHRPRETEPTRYRVLWERRAPGNTCLSAYADGAFGTPDAPLNSSKGCGGVMRIAAFGLDPTLSTKQTFELASRAAAQTHGHPSGYLSAGVLAMLLRGVLDGARPDAAATEALATARRWKGCEKTQLPDHAT